MFQDSDKYETYKDMTGTVRLTIKNTVKKDKGKYIARIFRCEKEVTESILSVVGESYNNNSNNSSNSDRKERLLLTTEPSFLLSIPALDHKNNT